MLEKTILPRFVVFEGVDGSGKTTLVKALAKYYRSFAPHISLYVDSFPGSIPGTLGEWVYRLHHKKAVDAPAPDKIAPPALQLLHVAAHVDAILTRIIPTLERNGNVILDRYWWSTYAYSRNYLTAGQAWSLVYAERNFLSQLPQPIFIYLMRRTSLKADEIDPTMHAALDNYYYEVIEAEQKTGMHVYKLNNDGTIISVWTELLKVLELPYREM